MKRMREIDVKALFAFVTNMIDIEAIPLDDQNTYNLLARADTDGVYMMETDWDKYVALSRYSFAVLRSFFGGCKLALL